MRQDTMPRDPVEPSAATEPRRSLVGGLDPALLPDAIALRDWLLSLDATGDSFTVLMSGLAERLNGLGIPVDRLTTAMEALHSEYVGVGRIWEGGRGSTTRMFNREERARAYDHSPFAAAQLSGEWIVLDLPTTPDDLYGIVPELKAAGYADYICVPLVFTSGTENGITFASRLRGGLDARARAIIRFILPALTAALELRAINQRLINVLRIYVGEEPQRAILSGAIRRGEVSRIRSAILFADMRDYTSITSAIAPEGAVELLNTFFDCLVPPIEAEGGEVLKYLGDGLLAIFRDHGDDTGGSAQSALTAAITGLVRLEEANRAGAFPVRIQAGIALHHGEAAYGNVGSGVRLDFTVIGPDVNLASRLASMNKVLGEPLLMSRAFAEHLWGDPEPIGSYELHGIHEPVPIYRMKRIGDAADAS